MNKIKLHELVERQEQNICQIVAYRGGKEILNDTWHGFSQTDACHVMSVTKSVVSLLIGIAIDQGKIKSVDQKVLDFFPDYQIKRGEKTIQEVTIRHLLTMTAPYKYRHEPWSKVCGSQDWTIAALDLLGGKKGITGDFLYSTLGVHILTGILFQVSGMTSVEYANRYLFEPLGIEPHTNFYAKTAKEHRIFTLSKLPKEQVWFADPKGIGTAGYGLCLSAKDMAKIGMLYLNEGEFNGKRIVSAKWILDSTTPYFQCDKKFNYMAYGYLWWIVDAEKKIYAAIGDGGNVIYVDHASNTVVAVTATFKPRVFDRVDFIQKYIV